MSNKDVARIAAGAVLVALLGGEFHPAAAQSAFEGAPEGRIARADRRMLGPGEIDPTMSRVYIFVDKTGFGHPHGVVGRLREGKFRITDRSASAGRMVFEMASFVADTADARRYLKMAGDVDAPTRQQVTANMLGSDVLDVAHFPIAVFEIDTVRQVDRRKPTPYPEYKIDGRLTLHGVTHPLHFIAAGRSERGFLHLKGGFAIQQTAYNIRPFRKALGTVGVADELQVHGDLWVKE
jgi:polyisoprenoid-binding protein YceI